MGGSEWGSLGLSYGKGASRPLTARTNSTFGRLGFPPPSTTHSGTWCCTSSSAAGLFVVSVPIPGKKMALTLVGVLVAAAAGGGSQTFSYADGSTMTVALVGEGDVARVTVVPKGANEDFPRYQGFINATALKVRY